MITPLSKRKKTDRGFLEDGSIRTTTGSNNILFVIPNLCPQVEGGKRIALLGYRLAEMTGAYSVINSRRYRIPVDGDRSPNDLRMNNEGPEDKKYKVRMALRQVDILDNGGIPVDLNSYSAASVAATDYLESIWSPACEIGWHAEPLVFFLQGIDDTTADTLDLDIGVGAGCISTEEDAHDEINLTAARELVDELSQSLSAKKPELRIREGVAGHALEDRDHVAWWLRRAWHDRYDPSENSWRAPEVHCILLTFRCSGFHREAAIVENTLSWLAEAFTNLNVFQSIADDETKSLAEKDPQPKEDEEPIRNETSDSQASSPMISQPQSLPSEPQPPAAISENPQKQVKKSHDDDQLVREALDFIGEKTNETVYKGSLEIGDYILEKFFDGDVERARSKKPTKPASYSALCKHRRLVVHPTTLGIMVRVAAQEQFFEVQGLTKEKLSYSHKAELVRLPDDETKVALFKEAVDGPLSVRGLAKRVKQVRGDLVSHKPSASPGNTQGGFDPDRLLRKTIFSDEAKLKKLSLEKRQKYLQEISTTLERLTQYVAQYNDLKKLLEGTTLRDGEKPE